MYVFIPHLLYSSLNSVQEQNFIIVHWMNRINTSYTWNEYNKLNFRKYFPIHVLLPVRQFLCLHEIDYAWTESRANVVSAKRKTWRRVAHTQQKRKEAHQLDLEDPGIS